MPIARQRYHAHRPRQGNLPEQKKFGPDGQEIPSEWEKVTPGRSRYNVLTFEVRGKSVVELVKGLIKRSVTDGKLQDFIPWGK